MAVIISGNIVLGEASDFPLNHARILYRSLWRDPNATVTASSAALNKPAVAAANENTYERWQPTSLPATWTITLPVGRQADAIGIAAHTLGTNAVTVTLEYLDEGAWIAEKQFIPSTDETIMVLFPMRNAAGYRISLSGGTGIPSLGVIFVGRAMQMQRPIYGGHSPLNLSRETTTYPSGSEAGNWLGRSVIRSGYSTSFSWSNLTASWYRQYFDTFVRYSTQSKGPFFIAWRPSEFPSEVGYCWVSGSDISPSNSGTRNLMSVSMSVNAYASLTETPATENYS